MIGEAVLTRARQVAGGRSLPRLLVGSPAADGFLSRAVPNLQPTITMPAGPKKLGSQIGPYKILEQLAEGGMGAVYVAEQAKPVRRKVALKIIKPGMATKDVLARFDAERQALALMDHPNIARIFDAGATDSGQWWCPAAVYSKARQKMLIWFTAVRHPHRPAIVHASAHLEGL